jgi:hypothetical protein
MRVGMVVRNFGSGLAFAATMFVAGAAMAQAPSTLRSPGAPGPGRPMIPGPSGVILPPSLSLRDALFGQQLAESRRRTAPMVARFVSETGDTFTLDRTAPRPLLRFDGSGEVWALEAQAAPRGDVIYKNDLGETMLRATRLGGLTVFTPRQPDGAAAALLGGGQPLRLQSIGPQQLLVILAKASERASAAARRVIPVRADLGDHPEKNAPLVADAAGRAADAVVRMSRSKKTLKFVDKIVEIVIGEGRKAEAVMGADGVVRISVAPDQGLAGRPSSDRIAFAAGVR